MRTESWFKSNSGSPGGACFGYGSLVVVRRCKPRLMEYRRRLWADRPWRAAVTRTRHPPTSAIDVGVQWSFSRCSRQLQSYPPPTPTGACPAGELKLSVWAEGRLRQTMTWLKLEKLGRAPSAAMRRTRPRHHEWPSSQLGPLLRMPLLGALCWRRSSSMCFSRGRWLLLGRDAGQNREAGFLSSGVGLSASVAGPPRWTKPLAAT